MAFLASLCTPIVRRAEGVAWFRSRQADLDEREGLAVVRRPPCNDTCPLAPDHVQFQGRAWRGHGFVEFESGVRSKPRGGLHDLWWRKTQPGPLPTDGGNMTTAG